MTETNPDTWSWRDLPVLREAVRGVDQEPIVGIRIGEVATATGLTNDDVYRASHALQSAHLVHLERYAGGGGDGDRFTQVSGAARVHVGQWPSEETGLERMIAALEAIANNTAEDDDTRTRARKILDGITGAGKQIGMAMAIAYATGQVPRHGG